MPKQITLEEIVKELKTQFVWQYTDKGHELGFKDEVIADPQDLEDFITTYFTQFAEGLRLDRRGGNPEMETNQDYGFNKAKATLDNNINKALGKE